MDTFSVLYTLRTEYHLLLCLLFCDFCWFKVGWQTNQNPSYYQNIQLVFLYGLLVAIYEYMKLVTQVKYQTLKKMQLQSSIKVYIFLEGHKNWKKS